MIEITEVPSLLTAGYIKSPMLFVVGYHILVGRNESETLVRPGGGHDVGKSIRIVFWGRSHISIT